jgi:hypothetical protein
MIEPKDAMQEVERFADSMSAAMVALAKVGDSIYPLRKFVEQIHTGDLPAGYDLYELDECEGLDVAVDLTGGDNHRVMCRGLDITEFVTWDVKNQARQKADAVRA